MANTDTRVGLAVLRSLGRNGVKAYAAQNDPSGVGRYSRYSSGYVCLPSDPDGFVRKALGFIRQHGITHVMATSERDVVLFNERRADLESVARPLFPPNEIFGRAFYKDQTLAIAAQCGVDAPRTVYLRTERDLKECSELAFPAIVKPRHHSPFGGSHCKFPVKIIRFETFEQLEAIASALIDESDPVMVQEYVKGRGVGVSVLMRGGEALCLSHHLRVREDPPGGGVSVCCRTLWAGGDVVDRSIRLLRAMEWDGVAMVEHRWDPETGRAALLEVNGRFWGSLPLALHARADFPYLLLKSSLGPVEPRVADPGVWARSLAGETTWLYHRLRDGSGSRLRTVAAYASGFRPGIRPFIWASDDPAPAFYSAAHSMAHVARRGLGFIRVSRLTAIPKGDRRVGSAANQLILSRLQGEPMSTWTSRASSALPEVPVPRKGS